MADTTEQGARAQKTKKPKVSKNRLRFRLMIAAIILLISFSSIRTSLYSNGTTQHFLMHSALFNNVGGKISAGTITLKGSIPQIDTTRTVGEDSVGGKYAGALVLGTLKGSGSTDNVTAKVATTSVILDGIYVHNFDVDDTNDYAPLLINRTDDFSTLTIRGVKVYSDNSYKNNSNVQKMTIESTDYPKAATSLIGNVGSSNESKNINVTFTGIQLDGRNAVLSLSDLNSAYHTDVSIFTRATLLNRLCFDTGKGVYTYSFDDDWTVTSGEGVTPVTYSHNVTYGKEVGYKTASSPIDNQYPDQERNYLSDLRFTNPTTLDGTDNYWETFISSYLPYVAVPYDSTKNYYQLEVNHSSSKFGGCGTYNDPYTITSSEDFIKIYDILASGTYSTAHSIYIPMKSATAADLSATWHGATGHGEFIYDTNGSGKFYLDGDTTQASLTVEQVRTYVAGAYYLIEPENNGTSITISGAFKGLGNTTDAYAQFRGVIVGDGNDTIINKTGYPLIAYSNGSVVKDIKIEVDMNTAAEGQAAVTGTITKNPNTATAYDASGNIDGQYGAVIGSVLGGDNIIDGVTVTFKNTIIELKGNAAQFIPVGGYVGVILYGGVIFRGMEGKTSGIGGLPSGIVKNGSATDLSLESNKKWLYVNPIIGRVINGFAVTEASAYRPFEDGTRVLHGGAKTLDTGQEDTAGLITEYWAKKNSDNSISAVDSDTYNTTDYTRQPVTMRNGNKHYSITDICSTENKLDTSGSAANIEVPNGQAFFIMSIAVNSGMSAKTLGYNQQHQISRLAKYNDVEKSLSAASNSVEDYYNYAKNDGNSQKSYIWQNYTVDNQNIANANKTLKLTSTGTYYLPDGYKGVGNFFRDDDNLRMKITSFNGNDATISQNTYFYYFDDTSNNSYNPVSANKMGLGLINYTAVDGTYQNFYLTGNLTTDLVNKSNGAYITTKKASDLDPINNNNAQNSIYLSAGVLLGASTANITVKNTALKNVSVFGLRNTGGMIGYLTSKKTLNYTIETTVANNLYNSEVIKVHGRASTGGLVGKINTGYAKVDMNNHTFNLNEVVCECTNRGGNYYDYGVGGFIGMMRAGENSSDNEDSPTSNYFKNIVIGTESQAQNVTCIKGAEMFTAGVVGILNKCKGINIENCTFYNLSVEANFAAAGLVAFPTSRTPAVVSNIHLYSPLGSTIESTNDFAGGLIGSSDPRTGEGDGSQKFTFNNCSVEGYTISGKKGAGGAIGFRGAATAPTVKYLVINNTKILDCIIKSDGSAGALIGEMNEPVIGYNILSKNVTLKSFTDNGSITNAGYICGRITTSSENVTYSNDTKKVTGTKPNIKIVGFSRQSDDESTIEPELVGACNYGTGFGTGGYVIFADYNDYANSITYQNKLFSNVSSVGTNVTTMRSRTVNNTTGDVVYGNYDTHNEANTSTGYTSNGKTTYNENYPYVTSSRKFEIDETNYLTGDGVSAYAYGNSAFKKIVTDRKTDSKKAYTVCDALDDDAVTNIYNVYSDSYTEFKNYLDNNENSGIKNFPLIIAEDTNRAALTTIINNYLDTLTNTTFNFADTTNSPIYDVGLYKCIYNSDTMVFDVDIGSAANNNLGATACLKKESATISGNTSYYFKMDASDVDTGEIPQFSLIDVMFKDPSDTSGSPKIAYHLYVPVYVKKVLRYDFNAEIKSGTAYDRVEYAKLTAGLTQNTRSQGLFENIGNPVTIAFEYQYTREADEWVAALNAGDSLLTNYYKSLAIKNHNGNNWPDVTRLVLVDANNSDKYYYLDTPPTMNNAQTTYISLYDFTDSNGNRFVPAPLQKLMTVTVAQSEEGTLTPTDGNTSVGATVYDGTTYYRPITDSDTTLEASDKYSVTAVTNINPERYYLSIFTKLDKTDTKIYRYEISSPESFNSTGTGVTYTSTNWNVDNWRANKVDKATKLNLFIGNLYDNNLTLAVSPQKSGSQIMANDNRHLDITMTANVKLTQSAIAAGIPGNMSTFQNKAEIYQTFLMMYDKLKSDGSSEVGISLEADGTVKDISHKYVGGDILPADFDMVSANAVTSEQHTISEQYIELRNGQNLIKELYKQTNSYAVTIQVDFAMEYAANALSYQFPKREDGSLISNGSCVVGYSKIASTVEGAANSAAFDKETDSARYYTSDEARATLEYNVVTSRDVAGQYHYLGINSFETGEGECYIDSYAVYDTRALKSAGDFVELTLTLSNKSSYVQPTVGNPVVSGTALPIESYLTGLKIYGADNVVIFEQGDEPISTSAIVTMDDSTIYKVRVNKSLLKKQTEGVYYIPIEYSVKTENATFNDSGLMYSNYKVSLTAAMYPNIDSAASNYAKASYAYDHIIYTNARVVPDVIEP